MKFEPGNRVRIKYFQGYATGEVTIAHDKESKVLFDGDFDLPYGYYLNEELELIDEHRQTNEASETSEREPK